MGTLTINGKRIKVDDSFARLSPEDQQRTVEEISAQMGGGPTEPPKMDAAGFAQHLATGEQSQNIERAAPVNPQASQLPGIVGQFDETSRAAQSGFNQGLTFGFGDELYAGATAPIRALPGLLKGEGYDLGKAYEAGLQNQRQGDRQTQALNPVASGVGEVTGAIVNPASRVLAPVKGAAPIVNVMRGVGGGAATGAAYGFGSADGDMGDRLRGAATGGGIGAGMGLVAPWLAKKGGDLVEGIAQNRATSKAIQGAPSAADLKAQASQLFQAVDNSGVTADTGKFSTLVQGLVTGAKRDRINPNLDPKATAAYQELIGALDDVQKNGGSLTISDLHTLRQIAQKSAVSSEGRDAMFSNRIVHALDSFISGPGNLKLPSNRLGQGGQAGNELLKAISTWGRARRVGLVEEATYKAQNAASGFENGLRVEFRKLLQNKKTRSLFTKAELAAREKVANGTPLSNAMRLLGHFGFDLGSGRNFLGGMIGVGAGSLAGPLGALAVGAAGTGARSAGQALTRSAADRAARVVATPNVPNVTIRNPLLQLPSGALSLPVIDQMRAIQAR
jgi:hypothetical protein